jgi:hypothetical protein
MQYHHNGNVGAVSVSQPSRVVDRHSPQTDCPGLFVGTMNRRHLRREEMSTRQLPPLLAMWPSLVAGALFAAALPGICLAQDKPGLISSSVHYGPNITIEYLFTDYSPIGVTTSSTGRKFINFNRPANYTVVELVDGKEVQFPSVEFNNPPSLVNDTDPTYGSNYQDVFIAIQSVVSQYIFLYLIFL